MKWGKVFSKGDRVKIDLGKNTVIYGTVQSKSFWTNVYRVLLDEPVKVNMGTPIEYLEMDAEDLEPA